MQTATAFWTSTLINPRFQYFGDDHEDIKPINRNCPVRMPTGKRCRCNCPPPHQYVVPRIVLLRGPIWIRAARRPYCLGR